MSSRDRRVEVAAATILPVFEAMRETARTCTDAGWQLTTHTPLMPPGFFTAARAALESAAAALHHLALDLEVTAVEQWWRLSRIEAAGGVDLRVPLAEFAGDLGWAGRLAWERLSNERGFDVAADPLGQKVHAALGMSDVVLSTWHTAAVLLQGTPLYGVGRPGGRAARQELVAMGINLTRLSLPWAILETEDASRADAETVSRIIDTRDLLAGDLYRWGGHVGTSWVLGKAVDGASAPEIAGSLESTGAWKAAARGAYTGVSEANKLPIARTGKPRTEAGRKIRQVEDAFGKFLETKVP